MKRIFGNWWVVSGLIVLVCLILFLWGLPLFVSFMRPWWVRTLLGFLVLGTWGLLAFLRIRKARKAEAALTEELTRSNPADEEGTKLAARMKEALGQLRSASGGKRNYLYAKPWYMIIGPPGSGKTTALLNSGLRFPFADQNLKGVGGTRNLDFWFADEAALVDTAGRYTTQDSDSAVDAGGWKSFLGLLKRHRPLQPINGIIVAIGIDELIGSDRAGIDAHAAAVRRRLLELRQTLEVAAPVYVMLTKADLLAGFTEFYDDLDYEGRRSVLGATLPFEAGRASAEQLARAFDTMAQAVSDRQAKRLFEETDSHRRSLILGFPSQLQSLRARLMRFLDGAFLAGDQPGGVLRGFYLTSGVQEGAPLDRILSSMAEVYDRPQTAPSGSAGRAYFLNRLIGEVMFPEAGLVQMDPKARKRQRAQLAGMATGIGAIAALTLIAWGISFFGNRSFQADMLARSTATQDEVKQAGIDLVEVRESDPDLGAALPVLNALRDLPQGYGAERAGGPPLSMRFGLFQASLADGGEEAYREGLRRIMLPRLLLRIEQQMAANGTDAMALYEPLKVYLMLGGQGPLDKKAVASFIQADWANQQFAGSDNAAVRRDLQQHLAALLEDENLAGAWPGRKAPLNGQLVAGTRALLQTLSSADRAYAVLRQKGATAGAPWAMSGLLSQGDTAAFANPQDVLAMQVPYLFTRDGFERFYTVALATIQKDIERDAWVMGDDSAGLKDDLGNIRPGVAGHYARDYIDHWTKVVAALKPGAYFTDPVALAAFTKDPSPLERVLLEVRKNTSFSGGASAAVGQAVAKRASSSKIGQAVQSYSAGRETGLDAGGQIESAFRDTNDYVGDGKAPGPIKEFVAAVREAGKNITAARMANSSGAATDQLQAAMNIALSQVGLAASGAPPALQEFAKGATGGGQQAQVSAVTGSVTGAYAQLAQSCQGVAQERYPFVRSAAQDAAMLDVQRVFGPGAAMDSFVSQRLDALLDRSGPLWRWRSDNPITATMDPASPEEFARGQKIRDLLVGGMQFKVAVERLGSETGSVEFSSGNSVQKFDASAGKEQRPLSWAPQGNPEAYVAFAPLAGGTIAPARLATEGPWALFRLMDKAEVQNAGPQSIRATFRSGPHWATLLFQLPTPENPFSRGGLWSFRCPGSL